MYAKQTMQSVGLGVLLMLLAVFLYDLMGAIVKLLSPRYTTQQLTVLRNLFGLVPLVIVLAASGYRIDSARPYFLKQWKLALARGAIGVGAQMCFYFSLLHMELATAATLVFAGPLFITALSVPLLRHRIGLWRWSAVIIGFIGVVWVLQPSTATSDWYLALPVCAALGYASTAVIASLFDKSVPSALINLYYSLTALTCATVLTLVTGGFDALQTPEDWFWLACMGVAGGLAAFCMTQAYRIADPSSLSPFQYFGIPSSFFLGWVFFAEAPLGRLIPGVFLIIGGGLIIALREHNQARSQSSKQVWRPR